MENKINVSNLTYTSPDLGSQKSQGFSQDLNSPKFTRKRTDNQSFFSRRAEKRGELEQKITFISPKKYLEHQLTGTSSYRLIAPSSNFGQSLRPQENIGTQKNSLVVQSTSNMNEIKMSNHKFESGEQIRARVRANQENADYKIKCQGVDKKITELNDKIKCMKEENSYLYKKIEDFNGVILEKNAIINQFSHLLKEKQQSIMASHSQAQFLRRRNQDLQNSIVCLSKTIQQNSKCSCTNMSDQTDDGEREKQGWQLQIQKYRTKVQQLQSSFKYSEIQNSMYQKMRYDLDSLICKNDSLKNQNKKLIARIEFLTDKQPISRNSLVQQKRRSQIEVDFELSPEK